MAKRQRPDGGDEATFAKSDGTKDRGRPHKSCKPASRQPYPAAQQPEATVRGLQAADIRAPGMSSTSTFAQLQVSAAPCQDPVCVITVSVDVSNAIAGACSITFDNPVDS